MSAIMLLSVDQFVFFGFHSSELSDLEFICFFFFYKAYDHLCTILWFCGIFMLRLSFYFPS